MKRFGIIAALFLMLLGFSGKASAQFFGDVPDMKGKVTYGGDFDFGIYGSYLNFAIAPQVGYRIFNPWEVGVRGVYNLKCYFYYNEYYHYLMSITIISALRLIPTSRFSEVCLPMRNTRNSMEWLVSTMNLSAEIGTTAFS